MVFPEKTKGHFHLPICFSVSLMTKYDLWNFWNVQKQDGFSFHSGLTHSGCFHLKLFKLKVLTAHYVMGTHGNAKLQNNIATIFIWKTLTKMFS